MFRLTSCLASVAVVLLMGTAQAVDIETVPVGNLGNTGEWAGRSYDGYGEDRICGAVGYAYSIGKYEVTAGQYRDFLNAVDPNGTNTDGLYNRFMINYPPLKNHGCQITWNSNSSTYDFSGAPSGSEVRWADRPVNYVSWYDAAMFVNWLTSGNIHQGAYDTSSGANWGAQYPSDYTGITVHDSDDMDALASTYGTVYVIPTEDEWYKAAYHKNDGVTDNYFDYPTSSDSVPGYVNNSGNLTGTGTRFSDGVTDPGNYATYDGDSGTAGIGPPYYHTEVGAWENSDSPYGTFDQGGNVAEWNESIPYRFSRGLRGGSFELTYTLPPLLHASARYVNTHNPTNEHSRIGFRVASIWRPLVRTWDNQGGTGNYNWEVAANWSPDNVPDALTVAVIDNGDTVLLNAVYEAHTVSVGDGGLLITVDGQLTVGVDTFVAANSTISVDGVLTTTSANSQGTMSVTRGGQLVATEDFSLSVSGMLQVAGTLTAGQLDNEGELVVQADGTLTAGQLDNGGELVVQADGTLTAGQIDSGGGLVVEPGGQLTATEGVRFAPASTSRVDGTFTAGAVAFDGTLWVNGTLNTSDMGVLGAMNVMPDAQVTVTGNVDMAAGSTLRLDGTLNVSENLHMQNGSTLDVNGSLTSASIYCSGTLRNLSGGAAITSPITVADGGIISPGDGVGVLTVDSIAFQDGASLEIELGGKAPDNESDQLNVTGELDLSSTRDFLLLKWLPSGSGSKFGGDYVVAPYGTRIGIFDSVGGGSDPYSIGQAYVKGVDYFSGRVTVSLHPLLDGDADLDGKVWLSDWAALRANFGNTGVGKTWIEGNFGPWEDNKVWLSDWATLRANFGNGGNTAVEGGAATVPEPGTLAMLGIGVVSLGLIRRRRKQ